MKCGKKQNADMNCKTFSSCSWRANECLEQTQRQPDCPAHLLPLLLQGCGVQGSIIIIIFLILWINDVPIEKSSSEGHDRWQRQAKVFNGGQLIHQNKAAEWAEPCWHGSRTVNRWLLVVDLYMYLFIVMVTFIHSFTHLCFLLLLVNKIYLFY